MTLNKRAFRSNTNLITEYRVGDVIAHRNNWRVVQFSVGVLLGICVGVILLGSELNVAGINVLHDASVRSTNCTARDANKNVHVVLGNRNAARISNLSHLITELVLFKNTTHAPRIR